MSNFTETQHQTHMHECMEWEMGLSAHKEKIKEMKEELNAIVNERTEHDYQVRIEHFQNQFHIQLINIHDQEHAIRNHMDEVNHHPEYRFKDNHHQLKEDFISLQKALEELEGEFKIFLAGQ